MYMHMLLNMQEVEELHATIAESQVYSEEQREQVLTITS